MFKKNVREINGALIRLQALSSLSNKKITQKLLKMNYIMTLERGNQNKKNNFFMINKNLINR